MCTCSNWIAASDLFRYGGMTQNEIDAIWGASGITIKRSGVGGIAIAVHIQSTRGLEG